MLQFFIVLFNCYFFVQPTAQKSNCHQCRKEVRVDYQTITKLCNRLYKTLVGYSKKPIIGSLHASLIAEVCFTYIEMECVALAMEKVPRYKIQLPD